MFYRFKRFKAGFEPIRYKRLLNRLTFTYFACTKYLDSGKIRPIIFIEYTQQPMKHNGLTT